MNRSHEGICLVWFPTAIDQLLSDRLRVVPLGKTVGHHLGQAFNFVRFLSGRQFLVHVKSDQAWGEEASVANAHSANLGRRKFAVKRFRF